MNSLLLKSPLLQSSALSPQYWPFSLDWIPATAYLVGGCVRDALLEYASPYLDLDFVMPQDPIQTAQAIARHYGAGFVVLDAERQIARVVFDNATADFALQVGDSLLEDLERRDFTVNAIAYSPHTQTLVDPLGGRKDLEKRTLQMVSVENLKDDPLRLLRAYRQAAQLNFMVDPETRLQLHALAPLLSKVAAERIRVELSYLLSHAKGTRWLTELWQDGLLHSSFPDATTEGLASIERMDRAEAEVTARWPQLEALLHRTLSDRPKSGEGVRRTLFATGKLVGLVHPDPQIAKQTLQAMKYSKAEINLVLTVLQGLSQLRQDLSQGPLSRARQYLLFRAVREAFPSVAVVAIAAGIPLADVAPLVDEYLNPESAIAHPAPLVSGQALMSALSLSPGPLVGQLLAALELARAEGTIATAAEAIQMAQQIVYSAPR
ncbi:CCA tRNA nucleotidyltransferase [Altericista sp. CCNU0014]|uniref:CCA tRNA nucleotidyltransferase n=1 Tax=Altericista sp. CCNU0014 TaxID=3082949 RepID=UPI00384DDD7C